MDASPWVSPIVVTTKKGGGIRLCVDLWDPNKSVIMDCHPLPHIEDLFTQLSGATVFSQIDLTSAYYQLPLQEESRNLIAFITHLASAPSCFQKMMQTVLKDLSGVHNYLDNVIVHGASQTDHDKHFKAVLQRFTKFGLQLNLKKCSFSQDSITYLGHVISKEGL